jgi:hypothetical protein
VKHNFLCIFTTGIFTFFFAYSAVKQEDTLQPELSPNNATRTINKEVGEFLLAETMAILPLIVAMNPKEIAKASLVCSNNCGYTLSCAEFGGSLVACGPEAILDVIEFKKLLNEKDPNKLRSFMLKISNEKSIHCPLCKQCAWIEMVIDQVNP